MNQPQEFNRPAIQFSASTTWPLRRRSVINGALKRSLDFTVALAGLIVIAPLFALIAVLISLDGGPVTYSHKRIGRGMKQFGCLKFRTMILDADKCLQEYLAHHPKADQEWERDQKLVFDPRVTPIGRFLRATSLDELPQLINILKGEMSLVGPRPVTAVELSRYQENVSHYASVLPGLTGLWQVSGRNDISFEKRVEMDREYVDRQTMALDLHILWRTPGVVFSRRGAR